MSPLNTTQQRAFTLVELLMVIAIVAITLVLGLPTFNDALVRNRLAGQTNELIAGINLARSTAIELNTGGGICAANPARNGCGPSWDNGWVSWADADRDGNIDADEVRSSGIASEKDQILGVTDIRFDGRGRRVLPVLADGNSVVSMTPRSCESGKPFQRSLVISVIGAVSLVKGDC